MRWNSSTRHTGRSRATPGPSSSTCTKAGRLILNLWDSEEHSAAALSVLGPEVGRVLNPVMSEPSELIGVGAVLFTDLIHAPGS